MVVHCPLRMEVLVAVNEMTTAPGVAVRTGVGARVLVGRGVWVGAGRRVGVAGGRVAVPGRGVGVLVACMSKVGVIVGVAGAVTGVMVGDSCAGIGVIVDVGVTLGATGMTTTTGGVAVLGSVLTSARRLK